MRRLALVVWLALSLGCSNELGEKPPLEHEPNRVIAYAPLMAGAQRQQVGEGCDGEVGSCLSGLCLHVSPLPGSGYFCSQTCVEDADCPDEFRCAAAPGLPRRFCVPPPGWQGHPARMRPERSNRRSADAGLVIRSQFRADGGAR